MSASVAPLIATRYASALFDLAAEKKQQDVVEKDMLSLQRILRESAELKSLIASPIITREQGEKAIAAVLERLGAHTLTQKFFALLARQRRLSAAALVIETYLSHCAKSRNEIEVSLISASPLSDAERQELVKVITDKTGKHVRVKTQENPALIGGVQVRMGSMLLDNSIAGKLARLQLALAKAA